MVSAYWYQLSTPVHWSVLIMACYSYTFASAKETISQLKECIPRQEIGKTDLTEVFQNVVLNVG